jgi:integrase
MAAITNLPGGKARVTWYDSAGVRHRKRLDRQKARSLFETVAAEKLFENSGMASSLGARARNMRELIFRDLATRYLNEHLLGTRAANNACYVHSLIAEWGDHRLTQVVPALFRPWLFDLLRERDEKKRFAVSTIRKLAVYGKRIFSWGCESEIIGSNPLQHLMNAALKKEFRRVKKRKKTISMEEFQLLIHDFPLWLNRVCMCAWYTGMRLSEILDLTWDKVDLVDRLIRLEADDTKEIDQKTLGIEQELYELLIEIQLEGDSRPGRLVFLAMKGGRICEHFLDRQFRKLADAAGFIGLRVHDFRHCYTVRKRREGHDRSIIKAQTGHHTDSMFDWYDNVDEKELQDMAGFTRQNMDVLEDHVEKLVAAARAHSIPLGAVQSLIGRTFRTKN